MYAQIHRFVEGTIRCWRPEVARVIFQRAGYTWPVEPLSAESFGSPTAVEDPATQSAVPASQLTASILEVVPEAPLPPAAMPAASVGSPAAIASPVVFSAPIESPATVASSVLSSPASSLPWPSSPLSAAPLPPSPAAVSSYSPSRPRSATADFLISHLASPTTVPPPQTPPRHSFARDRTTGPSHTCSASVDLTISCLASPTPPTPLRPPQTPACHSLARRRAPGPMTRRQSGRARANSIDGIFVIPDSEATPRRQMDEIPRGMEFPRDAIRGELYHVLDHTITTLEPEGIDMGGRASPAGESDSGVDQPATPTPAQISGKRRKKNSPIDAPLRKWRARLALPAPATAPAPGPLASSPAPSEYPIFKPPQRRLLEVDMVELQFSATNVLGELFTGMGRQVSHAHGLFQNFNDGEKMLLALQLLANVSSPRDRVTLAPDGQDFTFVTGHTTRMLAASRLAQKCLENSEIGPALVRLRALMSYITLYLTLKYAIEPQLQRENPNWSLKRVAGRRYAYFYHLLCDNPDGDMETLEFGPKSKFGADIAFGKTYWSLLQELGVAALLMLAVGDTGLTVIARSMGPGNPNRKNLALALSLSRGWWSFAHAIGPATLRSVFGPRDIQYTVQQLLQQLRAEPLPTASIVLLNQSCQKRGIAMTTEIASEELPPITWELAIGETTIPVGRYPNVPSARLLRRNVWHWLEFTSTPIFEFLLLPGKGAPDEAVNLFCNFYNRRAIPGRKAVPFTALRELSNRDVAPGTQQCLDILANEECSNCDLMVFPVPIENVILGVILYPRTTTATIYNWTAQGQLAVKACEVGSLLCEIYSGQHN